MAVRPEDFGAVPVEEIDASRPMPRPEDFGAVAAPAEKPPATAGERSAAAVGGVNKGLAGLLGLPVDTIENIVNIALSTRGLLTDDPNIELLKGSFGSSQHVREVMEKAGIGTENPRPDDSASRMLHTGGTIVGGSAGIPGAGARSTMTAATGGAVAGEAGGDAWVGVGAMTPAAAGAAARGAKTSMASTAAPNVKTFGDAGTRPSVSQTTESAFMAGLENLAMKFPGGSGVMHKFVKKQQAEMGASARTDVSAYDAGRAIERGIKGDGGFLARTKAEWMKLDDAVTAKAKDATVAPVNTTKALDDLTKPVKTAETSTGAPLDSRVTKIKEDLAADLSANGGVMSYDGVRTIRSRIGAQLEDSILVQGAKSGEMDAVYGALTEDMRVAIRAQDRANGFVPQQRAPTKNNPATETAGPIEQAFNRRNDYYKARMDRIENVLDKVIGKGKHAEDIFKSVNPTDPDQVSKLRAVMRSLEPAERKVVADAVVNRLGRALPGKQNEPGEIFSSETFLSNWSRLSAGARAQLFPDEAMRSNITSLADASAKIRAGSQSMSNPSGTAGSFAAYSIYLSPIAAVAAGNIDLVTGAAMSVGTAYIGARMLTSPRIVDWLAKGPKIAPDRTAAHLARLAVIYNESDDETKADLDRYMESVKDAPVRAVNNKEENDRKKRRDELLQTLD